MTESRWIDQRPFEEVIMDAEPTQKYVDIVENIISDPKIYATSSTIYDVEVTILIKKLESLHKKYKDAIKKQDELLLSSKGKQQLIEESILETREMKNVISLLEQELRKMKTNQDITRLEYISLNRVAGLYKDTGSKEILAKGVEWTCSYAAKLRR